MGSEADRREPRIAIELDALVQANQGPALACAIRDFSLSGVLLVRAAQALPGGRGVPGLDVKIGDEVEVHFSVPVQGEGDQDHRLTATVKRVSEDAIGLFLPAGMPPSAFRAMETYARTQADSRRQPGSVDGSRAADRPVIDAAASEDVVAQVRRLAARALPTLYKAFFDRAAEELIVLARDAGSDARQSALFDGLNAVEGGAKNVARTAGRAVLDHIENPRSRSILAQKAKKSDEARGVDALSLVDMNAFEDWLAVADIISKADNRFADNFTTLCVQMGMLRAPWAEKDIMPLAPAVLSATFDDAMQELELSREIRRLLHGCFLDALFAFLRKLVPALQKLLDDSGKLPRSDELADEVWRRAKPRVLTNAAREVTEGPQRIDAIARSIPGEVGGEGEFDPGATGEWMSGQFASAAAFGFAPNAPMGDMFGTARTLIDLQRGLTRPGRPPAGESLRRDGRPATETLYGSDEIQSALARLRAAPAPEHEADIGIQQRLTRALERTVQGKELAPEAQEALVLVDDLLDSIRSDTLLPECVKIWLGELEMIYGQLAVEHSEYLDTAQVPLPPALQFLNELAELGSAADAGEGVDSWVSDQVENIIAGVRNDYRGEEDVFERAVGEIRRLIDRQRRIFLGNARRAVRQAEGNRRLIEARQAVVEELGKRLSGRDVPKQVVRLLNPGWRTLLVHSRLRHGAESVEYLRQLAVVDELIELFDTKGDEALSLVEEIRIGLEGISYEPGKRSQMLFALRAALEQDAVDQVRIDEDSAAELIGFEEALPVTEPKFEESNAEARSSWHRSVDLARSLEVGTWLRVAYDTERPRIVTIAWIGDHHAAFTLVNRKGGKVLDLGLQEMAQGLADSIIEVVGEIDAPLVERASRNMLQKMHDQLAYQATHDALTGLVNRKEFERLVEVAMRKAATDGRQGLLLFMDLDQFKVINNTCGHDAGDELLRTLVPSLREELGAAHGQLSRLGGDEFGILVERCDADRTRTVTDGLLETVRGFRFDWEGQRYALTASLGCVPFGNDGRLASDLLTQADAAHYAAKDAGRNRVQVFQIDDEQMAERRGVMEWVARVDQVLREDRILLTAQKIAPIRDPVNSKPHYEILMTVLNEQGDPMPPVDFITAAETYDRMPAVDRWVVRHALDWMSLNLERMDRVHGFSINLSGRSLNDPDFRDFVVKQLERTRVPTEKVTFEITETAAFASVDAANRFIRHLKGLGCTFSLDDFGTGLASYSYLRNLNVDYVKIDGMFVKDLIENPADHAVVKSISEIARFMGKQTIAECVESTPILDALREIGVDYAQGWGVERPKPLDEIF